MDLPFDDEAVVELEAAAVWYERERDGYGERFVDEVEARVQRAAQFPGSGPRVLIAGLGSEFDVRRFPLNRFPYEVITAMVGEQRAVIAIAHMKRRPGYWRERLQ